MGYDEFIEALNRVEKQLHELEKRLDSYESRTIWGRIKNIFKKGAAHDRTTKRSPL